MTMLSVALLAVLAQVGGQAGTPARDAATAPTIGTASISGIVVDDESPAKPVRRALVTLTGTDLRPNRGAVTDDNGRFAIGNLPAGAFTLTVADPSYVTSVYGAKRPGRPGTAIVVRASETISNLSVRIWRGGVLSGTLHDDSGTPIPGVPVTAIAARDVETGLLTLTNNGSVTNDRGEFRIFGLSPGTYVVAAKPAAGGGGPLTAMSESDVDAALEAIRTRSNTPATGTVASASEGRQPRPFDFAPVLYPGTSLLSDARPVTLAPGQEIDGLDLPLLRVPTATVSGVISKPDGTPAAGATVRISVPRPTLFASSLGLQIDVTTDAQGAFKIPQVTPGDYDLVVRATVTPPPPQTPGYATPFPQGALLWARTTLSIAGVDLVDLRLTAMPALTLSGHVQSAPGGDTSAPPDLSGWRVQLLPPDAPFQKPGTPNVSLVSMQGALTKADGAFALENIPDGTYTMVVTPPGSKKDWRATSAILSGRDLLDKDFALTASDVATPVTITLLPRASSVSGQLETTSGAAGTDVFVIAFAENRALWGSHSRRVGAVRPDASGHYTIVGLPPGDYRLAAVTDVDPNEWDDPDFLATLVPASIAIKVHDGDTAAPMLRIGG
jgi:uncharacterized protein (DUF2141 family)